MTGYRKSDISELQEQQVRFLRRRHGLSEPQARLRARFIFGEQVR